MTTKITNEKGVKRAVKKLLDEHRWFWWMPAANGFGVSGVSDIIALRGGVMLAIETKFKSNKPTEMQKAFLTSVAAEQGMAFVVTEARIETLKHWLEAFDRAVEARAKGDREAPEDGALLINCVREMQKEFV